MTVHARLELTLDGILVIIGEQTVKIPRDDDAYPGLFEAMKNDSYRLEDAPRPSSPVDAQTGQRQRFRRPIQANKTAAGKIEVDYGEYTAIEQRILAATNTQAMAQSNRALLLEEHVFIMERGRRETYPSPMELYSGDALFREFVDNAIIWQQQNAQNSSSRVSVSVIVKTIVNYVRPKSGWLDWEKARRRSNEPLPLDAAKPVKVEVIKPRAETPS